MENYGPKEMIFKMLLVLLKDKIKMMGFEPSANVAKEAKKNGIPVVADFFNILMFTLF